MSIFEIYDTANSGLNTMRGAMELASNNVANMLTPGYKAKSPIFSARTGDDSFSAVLGSMNQGGDGLGELLKGSEKGMGSQISAIVTDNSPGAKVYIPGHPLADADGNVEMSNVDGASEMLKMMDAVRQYKANLSIVEMAKKASQEALNMTKNA